MKIILITITLCLLTANFSYAETLAKCGALYGHAYYHHEGITSKKDSGWNKDKISKGSVQLELYESGYDIFFIDATESIRSAKKDGAEIILLNRSVNDITFIIAYNVGVTELYRFFQEKDGQNKFTLISLKNNSLIPKDSLMVGDCTYIKFDKLK